MDDENRPLRHANGRIIRDADGEPILLIDFINDPDVYPRKERTPQERLQLFLQYEIDAPDSLYEEAGWVKADGKWIKPDDESAS